jgi:hypothetical protein
MKKVFIVTGQEGTKIVTESVLTSDLKDAMASANYKNLSAVKRKDVEEFAAEIMNEMNGQSQPESAYNSMLRMWSESLVEYANLTPYNYFLQTKRD